MNIEEENYWRGYIDAKVEDLGKSRTHHPSIEKMRAYRDALMAEHGLRVDTTDATNYTPPAS